MSNPIPANIRIGGPIPRTLLKDLADAIAHQGAGINWDGSMTAEEANAEIQSHWNASYDATSLPVKLCQPVTMDQAVDIAGAMAKAVEAFYQDILHGTHDIGPRDESQGGTDDEDEEEEGEYLHETALECQQAGHHLEDCDEDGYCNLCGCQETPIPAECHSDDHAVEVQFDALPWFEQASDEEIQVLLSCGCGGDYPADKVSDWISLRNPEVAQMYKYVQTHQTAEGMGFECQVNEAAAIAWVKQNRPNIELPDKN